MTRKATIIDQASKYLKIGTCPAAQKILVYMGKINFSLEISKFSLALQPEALVNTSGRVLFSSPVDHSLFQGIARKVLLNHLHTYVRRIYINVVCHLWQNRWGRRTHVDTCACAIYAHASTQTQMLYHFL